MSKEDREFQYELAKVRVDYGFLFPFAIALLAISYGLVSYSRLDNIWAFIFSNVLIVLAFIIIGMFWQRKEKKFKEIRKKYIDKLV